MPKASKVLLLILDGWGIAPDGPGNAVAASCMGRLGDILTRHPHTRLACSGRAVGLPEGFMGNSEVGHMNIGAGRVVYQDMTRIDMAVEDGSFQDNEALLLAVQAAKASGGTLHLMGLLSDGGVHSHINHVEALLTLAKREGLSKVVLHAFLDGRDTPPKSGVESVRRITCFMREQGVGRVATIMGRYYAMDRDKHWERNALAHAALVAGEGEPVHDPVRAVEDAYASGQSDEFVTPRILTGEDGAPLGTVRDGDAILFFNFRADRARQICRAFFDRDFDGFERKAFPRLAAFVTMTRYESTFPMPAAFPPQHVEVTLGGTVSEAGLTQLRIAETEKYAHVTYFLNCGREEPYAGEDRVLVPSPRDVPTYDKKPEMSAREVTNLLLERMPLYDLCVCNLANLDMVGHTGIMDAAVAACRVVDDCVGALYDRALELGTRMVITADHGNSEEMVDASGGPQTAHTVNPVPLVVVDPSGVVSGLSDGGKLADIAPTVLALMGLPRPEAMTGVSLAQ